MCNFSIRITNEHLSKLIRKHIQIDREILLKLILISIVNLAYRNMRYNFIEIYVIFECGMCSVHCAHSNERKFISQIKSKTQIYVLCIIWLVRIVYECKQSIFDLPSADWILKPKINHVNNG